MAKESSFKDSEFQDFTVEFGSGLFSEKKRNASHRGGGGGSQTPEAPLAIP